MGTMGNMGNISYTTRAIFWAVRSCKNYWANYFAQFTHFAHPQFQMGSELVLAEDGFLNKQKRVR